jgi:hypothetical protein
MQPSGRDAVRMPERTARNVNLAPDGDDYD